MSLGAYFFLLTSTQHLLRPARNAFFLSTAGAENLPWVYIATAVVSAITTIVYGRLSTVASYRRQSAATFGVVIFSLILFWRVLQQPTGWLAGAFYVWMNVFSLLLISQFFLLSSDLFDPRQAKRVFGIIGAGGLAGGVVGSAAAGLIAAPIGSVNLLLLGAGLLSVCIAMSLRVIRLTGPTKPARPRPGTAVRRERLAAGLRSLRRLPHLSRIAQLIFVTVLVSTLVDWMFSSLVESAIPAREAQTQFFGRTFAVFNGLALVFQIAATTTVLRVFGLAGALAILPASMGLGAAGILILPGLIMATAAKGFDMTFRNSLDQSARELLYLPVPTALKRRAKPFVDVVVARGADGVAGITILLGATLAAVDVHRLAIVTLVLVGVWVAAVVRVRASYRRTLERLLAVRDIDLEEVVEIGMDSEAMLDLRSALDPATEATEVHYALDLLRYSPQRGPRDDMLRLIEHPDPGVRGRAVARLAARPDRVVADRVGPLLDDPDVGVRAQAAILLFRVDPSSQERRLSQWLSSTQPEEFKAALACLLEYDPATLIGAQAVEALRQATSDSRTTFRLATARALGRLRRDHPLRERLIPLIADSNPKVARAALRSAEYNQHGSLFAPIIATLANPAVRSEATRILASSGDSAVPHLSASFRDPGTASEVRRWIPNVFVEIDTRPAFETLLDNLAPVSAPRERLSVLKGLNKLRRRHPTWPVDTPSVQQELRRELRIAYDTQRRLETAEQARTTSEASTETDLYRWALRLRAERAIERAFRLEALLYSPRTIYFAYAGLTDPRSEYGAHAIELLETVLDRSDAEVIVPLIDPDRSEEERVEHGRRWFELDGVPIEEDLALVLRSGEPWLRTYAVPLAERVGALAARPVVLSRKDVDMARSIVEKAAALRRASLMRELSADDLLQLAGVAEEQRFEVGEHLFYEGEDGDYLYVVLRGQILGEIGDQEVFRAGPGEALGTFSILDNQPRSTSAVAIDATETLAIHRADMAQILENNYSLVESLFRHLTGIIRDMNAVVFSDQASAESEEES